MSLFKKAPDTGTGFSNVFFFYKVEEHFPPVPLGRSNLVNEPDMVN